MQHAALDKTLGANYKSDTRVDAKRKAREQMEKDLKEKKEKEELEVIAI